MTVSVPDLWAAICADVLPLIEKSCASAPLLLILKVTVPCLAVVGASVKWNSEGLPAMTVTLEVTAARLCCAVAGSAHASMTAAATRPSVATRILLM